MSGYVRRDLPADITVFAGDFASQPLVFAHLLDDAPSLDLGHVEVIMPPRALPRLCGYFEPSTAQALLEAATPYRTIVLILPNAYDGLICPFAGSPLLAPLGVHRGRLQRMVAARTTP